MKYYETQFEDYLASAAQNNLHPELDTLFTQLPATVQSLGHLIFYGPTGCGKYTQCLRVLSHYSPSRLKYSKKMRVQTDKIAYSYRISDIHYEIDMSMLGCNSRTLWHELFFQIVDVVSMRPEKLGIIVCKNFHGIHNELLEVFYSYMQQTKVVHSSICIKFFIITEHMSFLPNSIVHCCTSIPVKRPDSYSINRHQSDAGTDERDAAQFVRRIGKKTGQNVSKVREILDAINPSGIINAKEVYSFSLMEGVEDIPNDIFNLICDNLVKEMLDIKKLDFVEFREQLYDILVYNLDITECLWYVVSHFIRSGHLVDADMDKLFTKIYEFLKQYNNNYRPIYHLESIFFYLLVQIHHVDKRSADNPGSRQLIDRRGRNNSRLPEAGIEIPSR
jgi:hypothetical protein